MWRRGQYRSVVLPSVLAAAGLYLLVGCFYLPGGDKVPPDQVDPRAAFGKTKSERPLRIKTATRADVHRVLGLPHEVGEGGSSWVYHWNARNGRWIWPLCFGSDPAWKHYAMKISFGAGGTLDGFKVTGDVYPMGLYGPARPEHLSTRVSPAATRPSSDAP